MRMVHWARTCGACPEQWEGRTDDGQFVYLRHRHGFGYVAVGPTFDDAVCPEWPGSAGRVLLAWHDDEEESGTLGGALADVLYLAGLTRVGGGVR